MRWFDLKVWASCALLLSACSDDGLPADAGTDADNNTDGATAGDTAGPGSTSTAVTTADPTDSSGDTDDTATTDPTGFTTGSSDGSSGGASESTGTGGGSTGDGTTTGGMTEPECVMDEDCMLVDDCCSCDAIPVGEMAPECDIKACLINTCASLGLDTPQVACNFGTCEVVEVSCDPALVTCDEPAPKCPAGSAPRVVDGCWGGCIPVEYCDVVPSCDACGDDEACIENQAQVGVSLTCVPMPPSCGGAPSCDCLADACETPFDTCIDGIDPKSGAELACECDVCV